MSVAMSIVPRERVRPSLRPHPTPTEIPEGPADDPSGPPIPASLGPVSALRIIREVAEKHGIDWRVLCGPSQRGAVCRARQEMHFRLYAETKLSYPRIGRMVNRDYSTVCHNVMAYAVKHGLPLPRKVTWVRKPRVTT